MEPEQELSLLHELIPFRSWEEAVLELFIKSTQLFDPEKLTNARCKDVIEKSTGISFVMAIIAVILSCFRHVSIFTKEGSYLRSCRSPVTVGLELFTWNIKIA